MGTIHYIEKCFDPEATHAMGEAFDYAWLDREASDIFSSQFPADWAREQIARRILKMTRLGERDPDRLAEDALDYLAKALPHE
jgi:hypothetical protein